MSKLPSITGSPVVQTGKSTLSPKEIVTQTGELISKLQEPGNSQPHNKIHKGILSQSKNLLAILQDHLQANFKNSAS